MNYALIRDGIVQNVIVADASFVALIRSEWSQIELVTGSAGIGWGWDNGFVPPPEPEVEEGA